MNHDLYEVDTLLLNKMQLLISGLVQYVAAALLENDLVVLKKE